MSSSIRPSTAADLAQIQMLALGAFETPPNSSFIDGRLLHWKYWLDRADFTGPRSYVAEVDGRVSAHVGVWPLQIDGRMGGHLIDWMASPDTPGVGAVLQSDVRARFDFLFSIGGTLASRRMMPVLGYRPVGVARTWALPLRPLRQTLRQLRSASRLGERLRWAGSAAAAPPEGWGADPSPGRDTRERPAAFFSYMQACPHARIGTWEVCRHGKSQGLFSLAFTGQQARIAGMWMDENSPESMTAAILLARREALRVPSALELVYKTKSESGVAAALALGMRVVQEEQLFSLPPDGTHYVPPVQFQFVDDDASYRPPEPGMLT